jgi:lipopolysaccharide export LptBFGC system permease protein LptF
MFKAPNKKILVACLILAVIIVALAYLAFFWETGKIEKMSEDYQKEKLNSYVVQEKKNRLTKLNKEIADLNKNVNNLSAMFVNKDDALPLLKNLENAAAASECKIVIQPADLSKIKFTSTANQPKQTSEEDDTTVKQKNSDASDSPKSAKPDEMATLKNYPAFSIQVTGTYASTIDYMSKMENLPYFIRPLTIDMAPEDISKRTGNTAGSGTLATPANPGQQQPVQNELGSKNVTMTIIIVVYGS